MKLIKSTTLLLKKSKNRQGYSIYLTQSVLELIDINPEFDFEDITIEDQILVFKKA